MMVGNIDSDVAAKREADKKGGTTCPFLDNLSDVLTRCREAERSIRESAVPRKVKRDKAKCIVNTPPTIVPNAW